MDVDRPEPQGAHYHSVVPNLNELISFKNSSAVVSIEVFIIIEFLVMFSPLGK